jgi:hypothetical protein
MNKKKSEGVGKFATPGGVREDLRNPLSDIN